MRHIYQVSPQSTWLIRHRVMWPDEPIDFVKLERDLMDGEHLGLFNGSELVSVISWFRDGDTAQFRKFATLKAHQKKGYGSQLLRALIEAVTRAGVKELWCNAREEQIGFYEKFGLRPTGKRFTKKGRAFAIMSMDIGATGER